MMTAFCDGFFGVIFSVFNFWADLWEYFWDYFWDNFWDCFFFGGEGDSTTGPAFPLKENSPLLDPNSSFFSISLDWELDD